MMTDQRLQEIDAGDVPEQRAIDECVTEIRRLRVEVEQAQRLLHRADQHVADLITVLRHAERACQNSQETQ